MAKITKVFVGDTWINQANNLVRVITVNGDTGDITLTSPNWARVYTYSHGEVVDDINFGKYSNYMTVIPSNYYIKITREYIQPLKIDMYELCSRLIHKLNGNSSPYIGKFLCVHEGKTSIYHSNTTFVTAKPVTIDKLISIYNTISFNNNNDANKRKTDYNKETINPCGEIYQGGKFEIEATTPQYEKRVASREPFTKVQERSRLSLKVGKIGLKESETGGKVSIERGQKISKLPNIQFRLFDREVYRAKGEH